jgi:hypothetical protein
MVEPSSPFYPTVVRMAVPSFSFLFSVPTCVNEFDRLHDFKAAAATHRRLIKVKGLMT